MSVSSEENSERMATWRIYRRWGTMDMFVGVVAAPDPTLFPGPENSAGTPTEAEPRARAAESDGLRFRRKPASIPMIADSGKLQVFTDASRRVLELISFCCAEAIQCGGSRHRP